MLTQGPRTCARLCASTHVCVCALPLQALSHYILCLYRGFDGLVAIGYFAIVPTNSAEMLLGTSVQFIAIW